MIEIKIDTEFQELIPPLTVDEFAQLEENVLRDGIKDSLKVWNGILIDGHNRYAIAQKYNLPFDTTELNFESRNDAAIWIIQNQLGRRNLNNYTRSELALKLKPVIAAKAKKNLVAGAEMTNTGLQKSVKAVNTQKEIAKVAGVSHDTIAKVEKIEQAVTPEVKAALMAGHMSINEAFREVKKAQKQEKAQERAARKSYTLEKELPLDACKLFCADIRDGLPQIENNSVDFIITDPPYPKEYLPLYEDLSKVAARVLKDGGSLVCMAGQSYLPEVIRLLQTALNYHWCICYLTPGGQSPQLFQKRVNTFWKPLLWFVKGNYKGDWAGDVFKSPVNDNDKTFHEWGQSFNGIKSIVERLTNPNDLILDPFLGGGTTGIAAVTAGRQFLGADIQQKCLEITFKRIKAAYTNGSS